MRMITYLLVCLTKDINYKILTHTNLATFFVPLTTRAGTGSASEDLRLLSGWAVSPTTATGDTGLDEED